MTQNVPHDGFSLREPKEPNSGPPRRGGIVLLIAAGPIGWAVANDLVRRLGPITVIAEDGEGRLGIFRRRARLLGTFRALGQLAASILQKLFLTGTNKRRTEIVSSLDLDLEPPAVCDVHRLSNLNSPQCRELLTALGPEVVAVFGTRLIGRELLAAVDAPFINYHPGINPKYRGIDPAYWALVHDDKENLGITIHLVDQGVDTGAILYQARSKLTRRDNIRTYQWTQLGDALPLFARALQDALNEELVPKSVDLPSLQHYSPTVWEYLWYGLTRSVW